MNYFEDFLIEKKREITGNGDEKGEVISGRSLSLPKEKIRKREVGGQETFKKFPKSLIVWELAQKILKEENLIS